MVKMIKILAKNFISGYLKSKIMFVSGYSNELISKRGIILEGFSYLSKPFDIDKLISMIDDLLNIEFSHVTSTNQLCTFEVVY